jgi:hypothetical protein
MKFLDINGYMQHASNELVYVDTESVSGAFS